MTAALEAIVAEAQSILGQVKTIADLEQTKAKFLGKSGSLTEQMKQLGKLSPDERPQSGALINQAKQKVEALIAARKEAILASELDA